MTKIVFPTDEHHPYVDMSALSVAMKITSDFDPDVRIAGSDGMDFYSLSNFNKDPSRVKAGGLQHEIDRWQRAQIAWIDASPNARVYYINGNHEDRLRRWLWKNSEIHGLRALAIHNLLEFERLGIEMGEKDGKEVRFGENFIIKHGSLVRKHSGYTARGELEKEFYQTSVLTGHTHRGGSTYARTRQGVVTAYEGFCLCDLNPEYVNHPNWQQGIVLATMHEDGSMPSLEPVPFFKGSDGKTRAYWRGQEYIE